jgi:hypothetical protein
MSKNIVLPFSVPMYDYICTYLYDGVELINVVAESFSILFLHNEQGPVTITKKENGIITNQSRIWFSGKRFGIRRYVGQSETYQEQIFDIENDTKQFRSMICEVEFAYALGAY